MDKRPAILLVARSGSWAKPYAEAGYRVVRLEPDQKLLTQAVGKFKAHGVLLQPPCKHLAGSGARWWAEKGPEALAESLAIVGACLRLAHAVQPQWWCLENPVGRLTRFLGRPQLLFNPCDYGDPWTKKTCLWGNFTVPSPSPVEPVQGTRFWSASERKKVDDFIPPGFARAFMEANR